MAVSSSHLGTAPGLVRVKGWLVHRLPLSKGFRGDECPWQIASIIDVDPIVGATTLWDLELIDPLTASIDIEGSSVVSAEAPAVVVAPAVAVATSVATSEAAPVPTGVLISAVPGSVVGTKAPLVGLVVPRWACTRLPFLLHEVGLDLLRGRSLLVGLEDLLVLPFQAQGELLDSGTEGIDAVTWSVFLGCCRCFLALAEQGDRWFGRCLVLTQSLKGVLHMVTSPAHVNHVAPEGLEGKLLDLLWGEVGDGAQCRLDLGVEHAEEAPAGSGSKGGSFFHRDLGEKVLQLGDPLVDILGSASQGLGVELHDIPGIVIQLLRIFVAPAELHGLLECIPSAILNGNVGPHLLDSILVLLVAPA